MKVQFVAATLAAAALLSACGNKHEGVHAVDKLQEAEAAALAKAPKAEEVKFDDEGQPTFAETSGATAEADAAQATDTAATEQPAEAEAKTDAAEAETKK